MSYEGFFEALAAVLVVAVAGFALFVVYSALRSAADRRRYAAAGSPDGQPGGLTRALKIIKRWSPALLAAGLSLGYYQYTAYQQTHRAVLSQAVNSGALNADSPLIAEAANTAVPPFGDVTGKLVYALGLFLTGIAATWFVLRFVAPVVPRWATGHGTTAGGAPGQPGFAEGFAQKAEPEKVDATVRILWALWALWGICALAACLVK